MLKKSIALLIAVFALIPLAFAGGISVDIYAPENASYGEPIQITFLVTNNAGVSSNVSITEQVELEDIASQKENLVIPEVQFDTIAYQPPYLSWNLNM